MSVHPTSENLTVLQLSGSPASAAPEPAKAKMVANVTTDGIFIVFTPWVGPRFPCGRRSFDRQYPRDTGRGQTPGPCRSARPNCLSLAPRAVRSGAPLRRGPDDRRPERQPADEILNSHAG